MQVQEHTIKSDKQGYRGVQWSQQDESTVARGRTGTTREQEHTVELENQDDGSLGGIGRSKGQRSTVDPDVKERGHKVELD